jgi:hypothetical protein
MIALMGACGADFSAIGSPVACYFLPASVGLALCCRKSRKVYPEDLPEQAGFARKPGISGSARRDPWDCRWVSSDVQVAPMAIQ